MSPVSSVDEYIDQAPPETRDMLRELRGAIRDAAPEAAEVISYQIPTYRHHGALVAFGHAKGHCGFYVMTETALAAYEDELKPFAKAKTTVRFPLGTSVPRDLVGRLVKTRMEENEASGRKR
jgi:uncharacterized protein YdhG (YjbR/CyaY superfamily)